MTAIDVLRNIHTHQIEGVMVHKNMMTAYDFLALRGFKRMHEYQMFSELAEADGIMRYAINHHNRVIPEGHPTAVFTVPAEWEKVDRMTVNNEHRKKYLKQMIEKWVEWERKTKVLYQQSYKQLCDMGEVATARKVGCLIEAVDCELKKAERLHIKLVELDFDIKSLVLFEDEMHDHYAEKTRSIGINIC